MSINPIQTGGVGEGGMYLCHIQPSLNNANLYATPTPCDFF